ncbi:MAG: histidine phosphatase family protein [Pseudohongiella sp.]|uniref:histidine phosphatase family protein n=1 Tax=Pseudohongiella sp. TaxID=1979412 RepID=UPI0034A06041
MNTARHVHLIRHGETNWNKERRAQGQQESVLTQTGKAQAQALASTLADSDIHQVYCSSSVRTRETAAIAFAERDLPIVYCDQLREIHMGPWEGRLYDDLRQEYPEQFDAFWNRPDCFLLDGAETFEQVQRRAIARLNSILAESSARSIAIVSHGLLIKTILSYVEQRPLARVWEPPAMHNCALSTIEIHDNGNQRITLYANQTYPLTA